MKLRLQLEIYRCPNKLVGHPNFFFFIFTLTFLVLRNGYMKGRGKIKCLMRISFGIFNDFPIGRELKKFGENYLFRISPAI